MNLRNVSELKRFDAAEYLETPEDVAEFISIAFEGGDPAHIANALGVAARSKGMSKVAREAGVTREALYKALSDKGDPKLTTLIGVFKALGLQLSAKPLGE